MHTTSLNRDDLLKQTHRWVWGACVEWNDHAKQFDVTSTAFTDFVSRTHWVVFRFLRGQQTLDGSCSDFECTLALEAKYTFGLSPSDP